ncbi:metal-dependent hydrolase [Melghirimyces algeriensis]|uniref:Inner membrane protein n=1 Tax=Melghirimyces algeriensis TaxID=910412 RepID=A0A521CMJ7_9BACL|nr:metal-dependent hydrolase [Melghirimyces algeriensis]SMO60595.1 inner membrane protein [Melghirimyces algeriensis]
MDNLTHGLLGYMVYAASSKEEESNKEKVGYATVAVVGAEIPDIEGFTTFMGPEIYLTWHRAFTHSILFSPVIALLAVAIVFLFNRSLRWGKAWLLAWVATLTHIGSDWANTWGTGLLEPLVQERYSLGILPIVDVIILLIFTVGFLLKRKFKTAWVFRGVGVALILYIVFQAGHAAWLKSQLDGFDSVTVSATLMPTQYHMVAQKGDEFHYYDGSFLNGLQKVGKTRTENHPAVKKALASNGEAKALTRFLSVYGTEVKETKKAYQVLFYDPRFRLQNPFLLSTEVKVPKEEPSK